MQQDKEFLTHNVQIISNDIALSCGIACIIADDVKYTPGSGRGVDYKIRTFEFGEEDVRFKLLAAFERDHPATGLIFIREEDLDNPPAQLVGDLGELTIPAPDIPPGDKTRNVNSIGFLGIVIGLNLSSQGQERAKQYAKSNQLLYAGTADLYNNDEVERITSKALAAQWQHKSNIQEPGYYKYLETLLKKHKVFTLDHFSKISEKGTAYAKGAGAGFFKGKLPPEIGGIIGSKLERNTAGELAESKKSAAEKAREEDKSEKEIQHKFKNK